MGKGYLFINLVRQSIGLGLSPLLCSSMPT
jgi:hypothetical protein